MPVPVDSDVWTDAETISSVRTDILEFLQQNGDRAYHYRELADEVLDTTWIDVHEREREIQRVGEDQYYEQRDDDATTNFGRTITNHTDTTLLLAVLDSLISEGVVERREVAISETDIPYEDWNSISHYTYLEE
jgi:hypothetical protein